MNTTMQDLVKEKYGKVATKPSKGCACGENSTKENAIRIGYSDDELKSLPEEANLGLGCGNPLAFENILTGSTVLDLGSGAGIDCFLAAQKVGPEGTVIGVDMTPEMIARANENKLKVHAKNVDFRLGQIEKLPVEPNSVDVAISNCVINLSENKPQVFREAFRVLKPGGVLAVSDIVLLKKLPWFIRESISAYVGCIAGASLKDNYLQFIQEAGFVNLELQEERTVDEVFPENDPNLQALLKFIPLPGGTIRRLSGRYAASIKVRAEKPQNDHSN
ncbi:MAG: arsenite methyltransferase [Fidelibacterota bacterium]